MYDHLCMPKKSMRFWQLIKVKKEALVALIAVLLKLHANIPEMRLFCGSAVEPNS